MALLCRRRVNLPEHLEHGIRRENQQWGNRQLREQEAGQGSRSLPLCLPCFLFWEPPVPAADSPGRLVLQLLQKLYPG